MEQQNVSPKIHTWGFKFYETQYDYQELITPIELNDGTTIYQASRFAFDSGDGFMCVENRFIDEEAYEINISDFSFQTQGNIWYEVTKNVKRHVYTYEREAEHDYLGLKEAQTYCRANNDDLYDDDYTERIGE